MDRSHIFNTLREAAVEILRTEIRVDLLLTDIGLQPSEQPGNLIGRYKLLERIGAGAILALIAEWSDRPSSRTLWS